MRVCLDEREAHLKTLPGLISIITCAGFFLSSCNEASFGGSAGPKQPNSTDSSQNTDGGDDEGGEADGPGREGGGSPVGGNDATGTPGTAGDCVNGDTIKPRYDGPIQKCIDEGKMWNFDSNQCTNMRKASFDCNFETFFQKLNDLGIEPSEKLRNGQAGNPSKALIVGCGESAKKDTILIQWFFVPQGTVTGCEFSQLPGKIITGCYGEDSGPATASPEEQKKIVLDCMNGMAQ